MAAGQIGGAHDAAMLAQLQIAHQRQLQAAYQQSYYGPPPQAQWSQGHGNLPYAQVGNGGFLGVGPRAGYGLDLNNNGRYDAGQDGVLAMDLNRDGLVDRGEIEQSRRRLMAFGGNFDFNGDGRVELVEHLQGRHFGAEMSRYDRDRDGRLSPWEFSSAGGRVMVDGNRDGGFQPWEQHSPYNFPTPGFGRGSLGMVDPWNNYSGAHHRAPMWGGSWGR